MSEGFDFLGFHLQWKRKRGTNKWHVYTFIADRPFRSAKAKIRALTPRTSQQDLRAVLIRINQITRGWTNYFKHAIAKRTFSNLQHQCRHRAPGRLHPTARSLFGVVPPPFPGGLPAHA
jgi:RNA-directed DNA polymerase